jgi:hypothetical protein
MNFRKSLRRLRQYFKGGRPARQSRRPARPGLESLEDRTVPTIVFHQQLGAPITVSDGNGDVLNDVPIYLIFNGNYWQTPPGQVAKGQVTGALTDLLASPYLSGTHQYRWNLPGHATFAGSTTDPVPLTDGFGFIGPNIGLSFQGVSIGYLPSGTLAGNIENVIDSGALPDADDVAHQPLYLMITAPGVGAHPTAPFTDNSPGGFHAWYPDPDNLVPVFVNPLDPFSPVVWVPTDVDNIMVGWVGTSLQSDGSFDIDRFTRLLSHEVVESVTDPGGGVPQFYPGQPHGAFTGSGGILGGIGFNELADGEPDTGGSANIPYTYRLPVSGSSDSVLVQPYWSRADQAYIVPDNQTQKFFLTPQYSGTTFLGTYALTIQGDQGSNLNDTITIDTTKAGGLKVTLNQDTAAFDPNTITSITVAPGGGSNDIRIEHTLAKAPVTIESIGHDTITFSHDAHSLSNIKGAVTIHGSGSDTLIFNDQADSAGQTYTMTASTFTRSSSALVTYQGVSSVQLNGGGGQDTFNIEGIHAATTVAVGAEASTVNLSPTAQNLNSLNYALTVQGNATATTLNVYDQQASGVGPYYLTYTLNPDSVQRGGASTFTYHYSGLTALNVFGAGGTVTWQLESPGVATKVTGGSGPNTYNVDTLTAPATIVAGAGSNAVGLSPTAQNLTNLHGSLTVQGNGSATTLTLNDQADWAVETYAMDAATINRSHAGLITYSGLSGLALNPGLGQDIINIDATSAPTTVTGQWFARYTVNVCPTSRNLDGIANLTVDGHNGAIALTVNDRGNPDRPVLGSSTSYDLAGYDLLRNATYYRLVNGQVSSSTRASAIHFNFLSSMTLNTGGGANSDTIENVEWPTTLNAGARDAITVGNGDLSSIYYPLTVDAHGGLLTLDDSALADSGSYLHSTTNTVTWTITDQSASWHDHSHQRWINYPPPHHPGGPVTVTHDYDFTATINYRNAGGLVVREGAVSTTYTVTSTAAGTPVTITGGNGSNQTTVAVKGLHSPLTLNGTGAGDRVVLDDAGATSQDRVTMTPTQVGAAAADRFFGSGGSLTYSGQSSVTLNLSSANDDTVRLTPSATTAMTVNGSQAAFQAGRGAVLTLDTTGASGAANQGTAAGAGRWTFGNRQAVTYSNLAVPLVDVTGRVAVSATALTAGAAANTYTQTVTIRNTGGSAIVGPLSLVLDGLGSGVTLNGGTGVTQSRAPAGSPYVNVALPGNVLAANQSVTVVLSFRAPSRSAIAYHSRVLAGTGAR